MRGKDESDTGILVQLLHDLHHLPAILRIEIGGWFIRKDQGRPWR